ncbi:uncharacterized protein LOC112569013 [Pomacea canaliculata]|uniref:uncharacterized protein LOC112569013 n=1 Tax=Pomacea canaliculata TaxID=400727 RepID=UPI000D733CA0|nr:uncharacterized protein LOC112569013 [Pomacea canaliculata]
MTYFTFNTFDCARSPNLISTPRFGAGFGNLEIERGQWRLEDLQAVYYKTGLRLTFPDINDDVITAAENSEIRIRFGVADLGGVTDLFFIGLDISNDSSGATKAQFLCVITYNTSAMSFLVDEKMDCFVSPGADTVVFFKTVSRQDDKATLRWTVTPHGVEKRLRLNVTYPPIITSLTFTDEPKVTTKIVQKGEMVQLTCSWVHGNPPTAVRLLHSKRQQMMTEISDSSKNNLTYELNPGHLRPHGCVHVSGGRSRGQQKCDTLGSVLTPIASSR